MTHILIVDDKPILRKVLVEAAGHDVEISEAGNTASAVKMINSSCFDIVVTDLSLETEGKDEGGLDVLKTAKDKDPYTQVIVVTQYATPDVSLRAMDQGAYDFVERDSPGINFKGVLSRKIKQAIEYGSLRRELRQKAA